MAPARRLRSILARVFRYLADAVQPGAGPPGAPAAQPLPAAAAGNEHWFAVVRERAPELLTGGGIHAGGMSPPRQPATNSVAAQPAPPPPPPPPPAELDDEPQGRRQRHRPIPQFTATLRRLRRRLRLTRRAIVRRMPLPTVAAPVDDRGPVPYPELDAPAAGRPPTPAGFDSSRPRAAGSQRVSDDEGRRQPAAPRLAVQWPITPVPFVAAPAFEHHARATRQPWPSFDPITPTSGEQPEFPRPEERTTESVWLDERRDDERWPHLPDDEMLWQPPVSTFNSHDITRLDDEQRGR